MKSVEIKVEGMHCNGCSTRLTNVLNDMEGVSAKVSLENKLATVEYDEEVVTIEEIEEAIEDAGFSVEE